MHRTLFRRSEVRAALGSLSDSELERRIKGGMFVPPVALGSKARAWPSDEVQAVINAIVAGCGNEDIKSLVVKLVAARPSADAATRDVAPERRVAA